MIDVLYEDGDCVVCIKSVGIPSQNDGTQDMVSLLSAQSGRTVFPVHRLDTAVGGVMVFALNRNFAAELSRQITDGRFKKSYIAVLSGIPEKESDVLVDLLFKDSRKNKTYVVDRERRGVKKASLEYTVGEKSTDKALVRVLLHTGRTHQIRVQFASRKLPLVGDGKYGSKDNKCGVALWSSELRFFRRGEELIFKSYPNSKQYPWNLFNFNECL